MSLLDKLKDQAPTEFETSLKEQAQKMVEHLEKGNLKDAIEVIQEINEVRDKSLYKEVGRLTRALHESIRNFHVEAGLAGGDQENMSDMVDASDRLEYVTKMTESAANTTMDLVDNCMPIVGELKSDAHSLRDEWSKIRKRQMNPDEFRKLYKQMDEFLDRSEKQVNQVHSNLTEILVAQNYQDLTGQVIKRVVELVQQVEDSLVDLVRMAGQVDKLTGIEHEITVTEEDSIAAEGPQIKAEERVDVVSGQDDVDDLLSSLGF
ncbi:protein phosphatase CheZ [Endozoicomonas sp. SM1973]|uniref:Protein phosphatase CheZ n=1 Tax=Spartinivicinus marinus TaxID=2994442 RepID=A0A853IDH5_9GAMM|nr:protein phosphatase CheZ [Spartinivicinus marinus]MCX4028941.1 protein phosphatase CheZ [Spartinivicinus marinus]NYZ65476.1 protein phosphatase CheZ [Spartinivicinus marinus]